ncbi:MAG: hypothetical protein AB8B65_14025 [Kordia sp.]|uniref:hypothetical protein n=1 Tax=Kordia sp. TaxID=1965332 RepID=UPI00385936BE
MKNILLILIFSVFANSVFSQEIHEKYQYKKEKSSNSTGWNITDLDSLVLYKNGTFHRTRLYLFHEVVYSEIKGEWKIKNDTIYLNIQQQKENKSDKKWKKIKASLQYYKKRRKLKPINGLEFRATHYLKRLKNK